MSCSDVGVITLSSSSFSCAHVRPISQLSPPPTTRLDSTDCLNAANCVGSCSDIFQSHLLSDDDVISLLQLEQNKTTNFPIDCTLLGRFYVSLSDGYKRAVMSNRAPSSSSSILREGELFSIVRAKGERASTESFIASFDR